MNIKKGSSILKKSRKRRVFKCILWVLTGLLSFMLIGISTALYIVFTPERITPVVMRYANEYMDAQLECESVELTFYSTFPNFGIRLRNGSIITARDSLSVCPQDTLLKFNDCSISFNPLTLYRTNHLIVNRAALERPVIYLYVSPEGKANWDILPEDDSADSTVNLPDITVKSMHVTDACIVYDDRQQLLFAATDSMQLDAKGTPEDINISIESRSFTALYEEKSYTSKLPFTLSAHLLSDKSYLNFNIEHSSLSIGFMDFDMYGTVQRDTVSDRANLEIMFKLHSSSFADLMDAVPEYVMDTKEFGFSGSLDFTGRIYGSLGTDQYPAFAGSLQLKDGAVTARRNSGNPLLQKVEIDCDAEIDLMNNVPSFINIRNIDLQNTAAKLHVSGMFNDIFTQPFVDMKISAGMDLKSLRQSFFPAREMTAEGSVAADVSGRFFVNDLLANNYGKVSLTGSVDVNRVKFDFPEEGIDLLAPMARIRFGSNVTDSIRGFTISSLLRANIDVDSLHLKWKDGLALRTGQMFASFRTSEPKDSATITEMSAYARMNNLQMMTADSVRLRATKISAVARLSPYAGDSLQAEWTARISLDSLRGRMPDFAVAVDSTVLSLIFSPRQKRQSELLTAEDSLRRQIRIDSMIVANRNSSAVEFKLSEGGARQVLTQWDMFGEFAGRSIRMMTPYFPLRTRLSESSATFTADKLSIRHTRLQAGASDMMLSGEIEGIRRALLYNGNIKANIYTKVDSMDCNEIIRALAAGSVYSSQTVEQQDSISSIVLDGEQEQATDSLSGIFVVPRNVDMELDVSMKKVKYSRLNIAHANGKIIVRNRSVRIPDMKIKSDIGNADFSMVYKAPTTKGAYTGMDMHLKQVQLKELINSIPMLDSLTPMMRSFEGLAECDIIAVTELDSLSNVIIPKTAASCYINGKNMVLLDGETFSTIAKKLYFKNKKRNIIDSISVDVMLADSKISVFPFVLSMDRYVAAIGGTQNLDMSFQYHISILKWPVPLIKIGLNFWGTPDKIHYSIGARKYENLLTKVKENSLESVIINLRQQLHDGLRQSINNILNEASPEIINRSILPDTGSDTVQTLFEMDTASMKIDTVSMKADTASMKNNE